MRRLKAEICYISSTGRVPTNEELALATTRLCAVLITLGGVFTLPGTVAGKLSRQDVFSSFSKESFIIESQIAAVDFDFHPGKN